MKKPTFLGLEDCLGCWVFWLLLFPVLVCSHMVYAHGIAWHCLGAAIPNLDRIARNLNLRSELQPTAPEGSLWESGAKAVHGGGQEGDEDNSSPSPWGEWDSACSHSSGLWRVWMGFC